MDEIFIEETSMLLDASQSSMEYGRLFVSLCFFLHPDRGVHEPIQEIIFSGFPINFASPMVILPHSENFVRQTSLFRRFLNKVWFPKKSPSVSLQFYLGIFCLVTRQYCMKRAHYSCVIDCLKSEVSV